MKHVALALTLAGTLTGCGVKSPSEESESATMAVAALPNLRFVGLNVEVHVPSGGTIVVAKDTVFKVPCNTSGLRARYKYGNGGPVIAGAHVNAGITLGGATYPFAQAALAAGASREAWASWGTLTPANTPISVAIRLDNGGAVAESNELDNVWKAQVIRVCP